MLEIDSISAGYSTIPVLIGVSINVAQGEFVSVVGPNGAGKTTLFKTISGILKPTAGSIRFEGVDLLQVAPSRRAHLGIAHVPEGRHVFPSLTVMEESGTRGLYRIRPSRLENEPRTDFRAVPCSLRAHQAVGRHVVRRRAANAGDRPRTCLITEAPDAR